MDSKDTKEETNIKDLFINRFSRDTFQAMNEGNPANTISEA
jgi:hypothetical protein